MLKFIITTILLSNFAMADENAWDIDSCMENIIRQFTCTIHNQKVFVDLQAIETELDYKVASFEQIYGIYVKNIESGRLYISCDDSGELKNVKHEVGGKSQPVTCESN